MLKFLRETNHNTLYAGLQFHHKRFPGFVFAYTYIS